MVQAIKEYSTQVKIGLFISHFEYMEENPDADDE
jgi:hypothetical protein